jgi:orotate phosphoribosyltransferase-like protein
LLEGLLIAKKHAIGTSKDIKKVLKLHSDGIPAENIASELEMSKSLVREYVEIIEDLAKARKGEKE